LLGGAVIVCFPLCRRRRRAWSPPQPRTYLKIVASEDGLRAAGAQEPEFTSSK